MKMIFSQRIANCGASVDEENLSGKKIIFAKISQMSFLDGNPEQAKKNYHMGKPRVSQFAREGIINPFGMLIKLSDMTI